MRTRHGLAASMLVAVVLTGCGSADSGDTAATPSGTATADETGAATTPETAAADDTTAGTTSESATADDTTATTSGCAEIAARFGTDGSANADLPDPESSASCDGDIVVVRSNSIPDYPYIETSPGPPEAQDLTFRIPAEPIPAATATDVPLLGALGVTLAGIPIYGPTEGTGGDVLSIDGILMDCGSHNGPTGFHLHLLGTSDTTECDFSPEEVAAGPQLLGYAFDGHPIYSGNDQYSSSWELTDESLFASDTWSAHTHVEGSGDLDRCNGRTDEDGDYAYYTTDTFPYVLGCFTGEVDLTDEGAATGAPGGDGGPPQGDAGGAPPRGGGGPPPRDDG